ncbi:peptide chain release factor 1 [Desulforamulus hydrothermalis]|uniref:Peptide chain release factor 1 n=1 Tax=Desulforamulus hydrothermalis Lam5 = DSM 18033 TaxID=1121428 RepID=K8EII8_9FIRM|nr:peptide chain release factor 1 [Desulforamulus hydrothermalis]CCO08416.1 Peptide chain release factor 1 [Desulforamulus hydrothermalis Lam5 = DSM 18033]SHH14958.1 bacterial peptide chain release factor 1 (bRF-1) [Desulforamulus hydrothermalis Lam5 = DSM 18033]
MLAKLQALEDKYLQLESQISDPAVMADRARWQQLVKSHSELGEVVDVFRRYKKARQDLQDNKQMLEEKLEPDFREMVELEIEELESKIEELEQKLKILLLPKDPNDEKNVIMEIRGGTGGEEAALFAGDLFRMYCRYAEKKGWRTEVIDANETDLGGFKEVTFVIEGKGAYSTLKFESGVHRVQRVPATESGGRIHTSAATVAVLPEAEEVDIEINPNDLRIDLFCASGPGGQCVNTTQSAVRITHLPTGTVVSCQDEKSQHKNKEKAMRVLRARLLDKAQEEQQKAIAGARKSMVGSGDRSERIRTYNFPQNRVTDHRIGLTLHRLESVLQGELDELIEALITTDQAERLKAEQ